MLARFIVSASKLSRTQWTTVAQRYHRTPAAVQKALGHGAALTQQLRSGQLGDGKAYSQRHARHTEAVKGLFAITDTLPRQATADGRKIGLLFGAHHAAAASLAIRLHEWFMLTPEGREHARQAYAPFADLAWTPPI